ncbi:MAG: hypothetical protein DRJ56_02610 [Thermoprotei archaeon]|nr:MAG: hypothetical protein DRJ56_02610 [Thermoprotei archaeon]
MSRCEICGVTASDLKRCRLCGRLVCRAHYDEASRLCEVCRSTTCEICRAALAAGVCSKCGRLVCEDCSVMRRAAFICLECLRDKRA